MGQLDRQSQLVWMGLATGADKSRRVDLASSADMSRQVDFAARADKSRRVD